MKIRKTLMFSFAAISAIGLAGCQRNDEKPQDLQATPQVSERDSLPETFTFTYMDPETGEQVWVEDVTQEQIDIILDELQARRDALESQP